MSSPSRESRKSRDYALAGTSKKSALIAPALPYQPPMPKRYRAKIGLLGCGGITVSHLTAYKKAGWEVVVFHDVHQERATEKRDKFFPKAKVCATLAEFLATPGMDVVDVATHPSERVQLIEACLRAGKHVLSQKPFVLDIAVGERLVKLAREKGVLLAVNQNGRWAPHFSYMRLAAQKGVIGSVGSVTTSVSWDHTWTKGTPFEKIRHLLLYDFGIHWFDFVSQVFAGQKALGVFASIEKSDAQPIDPPLLGSVTVHFEHGVASLSFHGAVQGGQLDLSKISGNKGILFSHGPSLAKQKVTLLAKGSSVPVKLKGSWFRQGFQGTMGELLSSIEAKRSPNNNAENNLDSLALCFAAIQSADTGKPQVPGKVKRVPGGCKPE